MSENLMNSAHKTSTPAYREGWDRIFGGAAVDKVSDTSDKPYEAIVNPNDYECNFWGHDYLVTLSEFGPTLLVNAGNEACALDEAIDYAQEQGWDGLFLNEEDIRELMDDSICDGKDEYAYLDEYPSGGNHGRYLSSHNVTVREVKRAGNARQM